MNAPISPKATDKSGGAVSHVKMPQEFSDAVDESIGLKAISLRMSKPLLERLKLIAEVRGIGYQPLMREVLNEFVRNELLRLAKIDNDYAKAIKRVRSKS